MQAKVLFGLAAVVPSVFLMQATGTSAVAVINFDRAVAEAPGGKDAITKLAAFSNEQRAAIEKKQKEAEDIQNRIVSQDRVLSEASRTQLIREFDAAQASIQTMGEDAQQKIDRLEQELLGPIQEKTANAVRNYAAEHSLKIVLDISVLRNGLFYVHDTADITSEIIRRTALNMDNPAPEKQLAESPVGHIRINQPWRKFGPLPTLERTPDSGDLLAWAKREAQ
jgi:Skp family chaperone for outer membrane proteins